MMEALHEIGARQMRLNNKEVADEFQMTVNEIEDLRNVFDNFDEKKTGTISRTELKAVLAEVDISMAMLEEDFSMLLESVNLEAEEAFTFKQFLKILVQVNKLLSAPAVGRTGTSFRRSAFDDAMGPTRSEASHMGHSGSCRSSVIGRRVSANMGFVSSDGHLMMSPAASDGRAFVRSGKQVSFSGGHDGRRGSGGGHPGPAMTPQDRMIQQVKALRQNQHHQMT